MALASIYRVVQDLQGNIVTEVLGTITLSGTSTLAALFSDAAGVNPLPNPLINSPTFGSYNVYVAAGAYDMSFLKVGYTFETQHNIVLRDPASGVNVLTGTANQVLVTPASGIGAVTLALPQSIDPDASVQFAYLGLGTTAPTTPVRLAINGNLAVTGSGSFSDAATTRTNLGLGSMALQNANAVAITGGTGGFTGAVGGSTMRVQDQAGEQIYAFVGYVTAGVPSRWNLYMPGDAPNFIQGSLTIASTLTLSSTLSVAGAATLSNNTQIAGRLHLGTQIYGHGCRAEIVANKNTTYAMMIRPETGTDAGAYPALQFLASAGGAVGSINTSTTATSFNTSSDRRLKHAVMPLTGALEAVRALHPVRFRWNIDDSQDEGFLAHELMTVIPRAVTGEPDALYENGTINPQQVDASKLVVWLVGAVQALLARVEALEAQP